MYGTLVYAQSTHVAQLRGAGSLFTFFFTYCGRNVLRNMFLTNRPSAQN